MRVRLVLSVVVCAGIVAGCGRKPDDPTVADPSRGNAVAKERLEKVARAFASRSGSFFGGYSTKEGDGLSWRVGVLEKLGYGELFQKFRLNEPWDSEHNKALIGEMPVEFQSPGRPADGTTHLRTFYGERAILPKPDPAKRPQSGYGNLSYREAARVGDGTRHTLSVVEAPEAVVWTKPDELMYDEGWKPGPKPPLPKLGGVFPDGFHGATADGTAYFFPDSLVSDELLRRLILIDDYEDGDLNPVRRSNGLEEWPPPPKPQGQPKAPPTGK